MNTDRAAIERLRAALTQLMGVAKSTSYWTRDQQLSAACDGASLVLQQTDPALRVPADRREWRCFHCDETFTDQTAALEHFGASLHLQPACQIDIAEYRRMEEANRRHCEEDTGLHRELHRKDSDHAVALRREEEKGYARGLHDAAIEALAVPEPQGWRLVPAEPTPEMISAAAATPGMKAIDEASTIHQLRGNRIKTTGWNGSPMEQAYRAMLAAAPALAVQQEPLTEDQIDALYDEVKGKGWALDFARAIEKAHGIPPARSGTLPDAASEDSSHE